MTTKNYYHQLGIFIFTLALFAQNVFADHALPDQMRKYQVALKNFLGDHIDFSRFQPVQIEQFMEVSNTSYPIVTT